MGITQQQIEAKIDRVSYQILENSTTTVCCIRMKNGFNIIGTSACVNAADFDEEMGRSIAYKKAFERIWELEGYLLAEHMSQVARHIQNEGGELLSFGCAISLLKAGAKLARLGWNGKGLWLELQRPDAHSKMTLPYIYMNYPADAANTPGARVPWLASQTDMLADDWVVVV
jgi:hypothetical protein